MGAKPKTSTGVPISKKRFYVSSEEKSQQCPVSTHAEMSLLLDLNIKANANATKKKINILVVRFNSHGQLGESKPCLHCSRRLVAIGIIKFVYYSTWDAASQTIIIAKHTPEYILQHAQMSTAYRLQKQRKYLF